MTFDLKTLQSLIHDQAVQKGWKTEGKFCCKRAKQELRELKKAVKSGDQRRIALESIDVIYFVLQAAYDKAPDININEAFQDKYNENWIKKKKTEDSKGNIVLR